MGYLRDGEDLDQAFARVKREAIGAALNAINNSGGGASYLVYTALLTQSGTDAPVATVLENTIGTVSWSRTSSGSYILTSDGLFTSNKIGVIINRLSGFTNYYSFDINYNDSTFPDELYFTNFESILEGPSYVDNVDLHFIEIRVYP